MQLRSEVLAELVEPALYALTNPTGTVIKPVAERARKALTGARAAFRDGGEVHVPSFELGVAVSLSELLSTASLRSGLGDAISAVASIPKGIETLHQIALINRSLSDATQGELADRIGMDRGNFNRRIRRLQEVGVVESQRRGQRLVYAITGLGMDVLSEMRPGWRAQHPLSLASIVSEGRANDLAHSMVGIITTEIQPANREARIFGVAVGAARALPNREIRRDQAVERILTFERLR